MGGKWDGYGNFFSLVTKICHDQVCAFFNNILETITIHNILQESRDIYISKGKHQIANIYSIIVTF